MGTGTIYLVGTGPGATNLITVKGLALVREAEAIVGDVLAHAELIKEARPDVALFDVGCRAAQNKRPQAEINQHLLEFASRGLTVVRLWPGDPFVYGRASLEMMAAREAGIRYELVPGVTSALAAPAYAGVPVTDWEYGTSFAVATGYASKNPAVYPDWEALARMETLVILMPLDDLPQIVKRLQQAGRDGDTPAVVIQQGSLPTQKQVSATLGTLVEAVGAHQIDHPAIVVVGATAGLAAELAWFEAGDAYPLLGQRVLVTRPLHQAADFMAALRRMGADPIPFPTIEIQPAEDQTALDAAVRRLGQMPPGYDWLVLTSANGVAAFWDTLAGAGLDSRCLAGVKVAAIGSATASALIQRSISPDLVPEAFTAEGVLAAIDRQGPVRGQRFLLPRADIARKTLPEGLVERGATVDEVAAYRTVPRGTAGSSGPGQCPPPADIVTFTSASTVRGYVNCLGGQAPAEALSGSRVVCIGPVTAAEAQKLNVPVTAVAERHTIEGLLEVLRKL